MPAKLILVYFLSLTAATGNQLFAGFKPVSKQYRLWYNQPAPNLPSIHLDSLNLKTLVEATPVDPAWENWSLPLGNGYLGASVFGRTGTERIQLTENSMAAKSLYGGVGLTNFAELYIDFNHLSPKNYSRSLRLNDAVSTVLYELGGVSYKREYFASYPDKVLVIKLTTSQKGKLAFTVRPQIPYRKEFGAASKNNGRMGKVTATEGLITLAGKMEALNLLFEGQFKIIPNGGSMTASNDSTGDNGNIVVTGADSAIIIVAVGTNYKLDSHVFMENNSMKKLTDILPPHEKVSAIIKQATGKSYAELLANHIKDYTRLFSSVNLDLGSTEPDITTDSLLKNYKAGIIDHYLEELYFQYGRYLLICSSRPGTLPPNLQGIWSQYDITPWTGGYWHNINIQMNYWPVFNTNLAELFQSFMDYNLAYRNAATRGATQYIKNNNPTLLSPTGDNGWTIGTGASAYNISTPGGHSGPGTGALTTKMFWDYYSFTGDRSSLRNISYPALIGMSTFLSKVVKDTAGLLLTSPSYSPEQRSKVDNLHYKTTGSAFDQQMIAENHLDVLKAAKILADTSPVLELFKYQLPKLDPVQIGMSGQVKEYREEAYYGDLVMDPKHRHTSQLMALYPGTIINANTPAWLDAAKESLKRRGDKATGWGIAFRLNLWARTKDGDRAYQLYQTLLQKSTLDNLWDTHPPFQIDGNFGGTAGVAEMLLQSHEGYIELLPALPQAWSKGNYSGLVARGNFVVSAEWENQVAKQFTITSKIGGLCKLKYPNIHLAIIKTTSGKKVNVVSGKFDLIEFQSKSGEVYHISSIPVFRKVADPINLRPNKKKGEIIVLNWDKSPDAITYAVYVNFGDSPQYTLLQSKLMATSFEYKIQNRDKPCILKITAVDKSGRESNGVTVVPSSKENSVIDVSTKAINQNTIN